MRALRSVRTGMNDKALIERFIEDPEGAYRELLDRFTPVILRMIRRFINDPDEVMETYTAICERLRANNFQALQRFRINSELTPWLSVVVANACRDRFRKRRVVSAPQTVLKKLDEREQLIFKYYYQQHYQHNDIAETVSSKHGLPTTPLDVMHAIEKINDLLTVSKRWHLLTALNVNRAVLSIEDLQEVGVQPAAMQVHPEMEHPLNHDLIQRVNLALGELDPEDQLLVLLRFEHGMKATQIAQVMRFENHKYVYTRLRTIVNRLRRQLTD